MQDITKLIIEYRKCIHALWPRLYPHKTCYNDWDFCDAYENICSQIFELMVLRPCSIGDIQKAKYYDAMPMPISSILVCPIEKNIDLEVTENKGRSWETIQNIDQSLLKFTFIDI